MRSLSLLSHVCKYEFVNEGMVSSPTFMLSPERKQEIQRRQGYGYEFKKLKLANQFINIPKPLARKNVSTASL